jgi:tripartite-type tricarboxylate transporter receptor subunit TctC
MAIEARMITSRRQIWRCAIGAAALPLASQPFGSRLAAAPNYPARPVHVVVTVPAGGSPDIVARLLGQWLSERLAQPFVIENRPGASANIGTEYVVRAAPDGHTLLVAMSANAINASLYPNLNYNFIRDTVPVALIGGIPLVLVATPALPTKTVPELIAYAKANPGKINMASAGKGTPLDVAGELFKMMAGVEVVSVTYQGESPAIPDLLSGQMQIMFGVVPASLGYIKSGRLRALAVTTAARQGVLPDVPAMSEFLPGFVAVGWYGIAAPKNTPPDIVDLLNKEINDALRDPEIKKRLAELGVGPGGGSPSDFAAFIAAETEKWSKVVSFAGTKAN